MALIIKYNDGTEVCDYVVDSHDDEEDSLSIADIVNYILDRAQDDMEENGYEFGSTFSLSGKYGIKEIQWDGMSHSYTEPKNQDVANFLNRFHHFEHDVTYTFIHGCCYWFAVMLHERFPGSRIMLCKDALHFVTEIEGRLYDITGDVTGEHDVVPWDSVVGRDRDRVIDNAVFWVD